MTRLILTRHGQTAHNVEGLLTGQIDVGLTRTGRAQAEALAARLADEGIASVHSSDLERAERTADIIAEAAGAERRSTPKLRERTFGGLDGAHPDERRAHLAAADDLDGWRPPGGETLQDVKDRALDVIDEIAAADADTVAVVGHVWTNRAVITGLLGSGSGHAHQIVQDNTCVNVLDREEFRGWRLRTLNDTRHLG